MNFMNFGAAMFAGQQLNAELEGKKAMTELHKQQVVEGKMKLQMEQQQMQAQKEAMQGAARIMDEQEKARQNSRIEAGEDPDMAAEKRLQQTADENRKLQRNYIAANPKMSEAYGKMADAIEGKLATERKTNLEIQEKKVKDLGSYAGAVLEGDSTPQEAYAYLVKNVGVKQAEEAAKQWKDPVSFQNWWKGKQTAALSAKEQLDRQLKLNENNRRDTENERVHREHEADRRISMSALAIQREMLNDSRRQSAEDRKAKTDFSQIEKINASTQKEAKPLLEDRQRITDVKELLSVNSAEADQQVHQALTSALGHFKGRATNLYYKDNKYYGSAVNKMTGLLTRAFTGRYQEEDRKAIYDMLNQLQANSIDPALSKLETQSKSHAEKFALDPDKVEIQGDFNRSKPVKEAALPAGATESKTVGGTTYYKKDGKWYPQ